SRRTKESDTTRGRSVAEPFAWKERNRQCCRCQVRLEKRRESTKTCTPSRRTLEKGPASISLPKRGRSCLKAQSQDIRARQEPAPSCRPVPPRLRCNSFSSRCPAQAASRRH